MIRVSLIDDAGKVLVPKDLATKADYQEVLDKARYLVRECDRLMELKFPKAANPQGGTPYLN
jgi:hypothetical protein